MNVIAVNQWAKRSAKEYLAIIFSGGTSRSISSPPLWTGAGFLVLGLLRRLLALRVGGGNGLFFRRREPSTAPEEEEGRPQQSRPHRGGADLPQCTHHRDEADASGDLRFLRKPVILEHLPTRYHVHHVDALDPFGVVQERVVEASLLELADLLLTVEDHVLLGPEADRSGRTRLDTRRLQSVANAVDAHRALVDLLRLRVEARNVEGTPADAVLAADALLLIEVDDAVLVLDDRSGRGAREQAARILAVEARVFSDQPRDVVVVQLHLVEAHEIPRRGREVLVALVPAEVVRLLCLEVVPFFARDLARLAPDAEIDVHQLGDFGPLY